VTALAREDSFDVRAIAHSRNARIAMEHTAEVDWQCRRLYYGRVCNSSSAVITNLTLISLTTSGSRVRPSILTSLTVE
jgi:hypothetical protein